MYMTMIVHVYYIHVHIYMYTIEGAITVYLTYNSDNKFYLWLVL